MNYSGIKSVIKQPSMQEFYDSWQEVYNAMPSIRCAGMYRCYRNTFNNNNEKCMECHRQSTGYGDLHGL